MSSWNAYPDILVPAEGSVKVVTGQKEFMMVPSDVLVCDNGRVSIHHGSDSGKHSLWRQSVISSLNFRYDGNARVIVSDRH